MDATDIYLDGQIDLALERSVIDFECEHLDGTLTRRLGRIPRSSEQHSSWLDRKIDGRFLHSREIDADAHSAFASKRIDRRLPGTRRTAPQLDARHRNIAKCAVQPAQLNLPGRVHRSTNLAQTCDLRTPGERARCCGKMSAR